jgi:hypothetical protein
MLAVAFGNLSGTITDNRAHNPFMACRGNPDTDIFEPVVGFHAHNRCI